MSWSVDQIQDVSLSVFGFVIQPHALRFDRDATLALDVHAVEILGFHLTLGDRASEFQQAIGQRGFAVIDVRDNTEVADIFGHALFRWALTRDRSRTAHTIKEGVRVGAARGAPGDSVVGGAPGGVPDRA